jgi:sigma-B regulation protein RsbQ
MTRRILALVFCLAITASAGAASVDGIDLYSTSAGAGPTIIFVHGWTCDTSSWREQMPVFDDDYRVIALDLPGHGLSGAPADGQFSMELFARAVEAVRAEAGADQIVLVGHSMGAPVIRQYAIDHPEHVAGLVSVDGILDLRTLGSGRVQLPPPTPENREAMIRGMFVATTPEPLQAHILEMMLGAPEATAIGAQAAMFDPAIRTAEVIEAPTLAVAAGTSSVQDPAAVRDVSPNFESTQVAGTGHFLMMEKPAEFNRILADFLERIDF